MLPGFQSFPEGQLLAFALVLLRIIAFIVSAPIFGTNNIPVQLKVLLAILLTVVVFPTVGFQNVDLIKINEEIIFLSFREIVIGLFLGFLLRFIFFAVQIAGEIIGLSTGLASAQLYNPAMGSQGNVFEQYHVILATLLLLALNGHHVFIEGVVRSFELAPISAIGFNTKAFTSAYTSIHTVFLMGIKMAAPIIASMFAVNVAMALIGRAIPQINVMMTGVQVTMVVGMFVLILSVPVFTEEISNLINIMAEQVFAAMKVI